MRSGLLILIGSRSWRPRLYLSFQAAKYFVGFGLYQVGNRFINYLSSRADQILISAFLGPEILGYYALAWNTVVQPVYLINPIMTRVFAPILATVQDDLARLRRGFLEPDRADLDGQHAVDRWLCGDRPALPADGLRANGHRPYRSCRSWRWSESYEP